MLHAYIEREKRERERESESEREREREREKRERERVSEFVSEGGELYLVEQGIAQ